MNYTIDGNPVNTREDWRHSLEPSRPQSERIGMFPGLAQLFIVADVQMPDGVSIEGYLEGTGTGAGGAVSALHAAIRAQATIRSLRSIHTVVVHSTSFAQSVLMGFAPAGPVEAFDPGNLSAGQLAVQQKFRWNWQRLV